MTDTLPKQDYLDAHPAEVAKQLGLEYVLPKPNELFIDLDSEADLIVFQERFKRFSKIYKELGPISTRMTYSKGGGSHVYVTVGNTSFGPIDRVALQAALGSDPVREMLAVLRYMNGSDRPTTCFFEVPKP